MPTGSLSRLFVTVGADISNFQKGMQDVQKTMRTTGQNMKQVGGTMTKAVTLPLAGLATAVTKTTMDFNQQMDRVGAIAGATGEDFEILEEAARDMGRTTSFSATEAAEGMEYLAMAGWDTQEMAEGLEYVLRMAEAAQLDLATAADITSDLMSVFGYEASEVVDITDILTRVSTEANTDIEQLGQAMAYAGPAAQAAGVSLEEASAMAGMFADSGIKGSKAGTTLRAMMTDLQGAADQSVEGIGDMSEIIYDSEGNMRSMTDILGDLESGMADMTAQQQDQVTSALFGTRAQAGFNIIMQEGVDELDSFTGELENASGATEEMGDQMRDNLAYELEELKSAVGALLLDLGEALVPVIRESVIPVIQDFVEFLSGLTRAFADLPAGLQKGIIAFLGLLAAAGPVLMIVGQMMIAFSGLIPIITKVGAIIGGVALGPLVAIVAAIILVIAAFKNWDKIVGFVKSVGSAIVTAVEFWIEKFWDLVDFVKSIPGRVVDGFNSLVDIFWDFVDRVREVPGRVVEGFRDFVDYMRELPDRTMQAISDLYARIRDRFLGLIEDAKNWGRDLIDGFVQGIRDTAMKPVNAVTGAVDSVVGGAKGLLGIQSPSKVFQDIGGNLLEGLEKGMEDFGTITAQPNISMENALALEGGPQMAGGAGIEPSSKGDTIINVDKMNVRDDQDIKKLARELDRLRKKEDRRVGV